MLSCYGIICLEFTTGVHTVRVQLLLLEPFYGPFSGTTRLSRWQKRIFWTLWCKGRLTEADTLTIWLGAIPSGLTSAHLHHPPFLQAGCPSCRPTNTVKALKATSTFGYGRRRQSSRQRCYLHRLRTC